MARSKQNKSAAKKVDGNFRQETREERRARIEQQAEARQQCLKIVPYVGGVLVVFMIIFALWVSSVPPKTIPRLNPIQPEAQAESRPDLMREMMKDELKEKLEETVKEKIEAAKKGEIAQETTDSGPLEAAGETIEL